MNRPGLGAVTGENLHGGGEVLTVLEAEELAKDNDFEVHTLVEGTNWQKFDHKGVTVWVKPKTNHFSDFFQTLEIIKKINADIYLERAVTRQQMIYDPIICRLLGKKYIYIECTNPHAVLERPKKSQISYRAGLTLPNYIITNAKDIQKNIKTFTKRPTQMIYFPTIFRKQQKLKRKHIIWVGRTAPEKRPEIFLELARQFPKEKFLMLTIGELEAEIPQNVEILKNVPNEKTDKYYASAKMLVHTSKSEGFGLIFLEAWKNKTPTISLTVNPDNVLTDYKTGFHSGTFDNLVEDVKMLLTNPKKWKELSENGYKYVIKNHEIKKTMKQYKELFRKIK